MQLIQNIVLYLLFTSVRGFLQIYNQRAKLVHVLSASEVGIEDSFFGVNKFGADTFGDIVGGCETNTHVNGTYSSMERVVITSNGNLQRIMSAYYGSPVKVHIKHCELINKANDMAIYEREVDLVVQGNIFCNAISKIEIYDEYCESLVRNKVVGIGQLFRYLGILPSFNLIAAGRFVLLQA